MWYAGVCYNVNTVFCFFFFFWGGGERDDDDDVLFLLMLTFMMVMTMMTTITLEAIVTCECRALVYVLNAIMHEMSS